MTAAAKDVVIGGYHVHQNNSLMVCSKNGVDCADPYAGAVLKLDPRDKLIINLKNQLPNTGGNMTMDDCMVMPNSDNSLLNLHTHGLIVSPYAKQPATGQAVFGDRIFECTSSQSKQGHIVGNSMRYEIMLNDNGPNQPHPLGIDWIHPHVHGIAKAQVSSGMASMIVVGDINKQLCAMPSRDDAALPARCQDKIPPEAVKYLILKDAQIVKKTTSPDSYCTYADQEPDFCGSNKLDSSNAGECAADPTTFSPRVRLGCEIRQMGIHRQRPEDAPLGNRAGPIRGLARAERIRQHHLSFEFTGAEFRRTDSRQSVVPGARHGRRGRCSGKLSGAAAIAEDNRC
jgi:hypothetical protein